MNEADGFKALELVAFFLVGGGWLLWQMWETRPTAKPEKKSVVADEDAGAPPA